MLTHKFYDKNLYPLQYFDIKSIPKCMINVIEKLNERFNLVVRGGLSYILITGDGSYPLKDIDLAMNILDTERILEEIKDDVDEIYYNKNTFGDDVLTLFWNKDDKYFKIDILLVHKMPNYIVIEYEFINKEIKVTDAIELLYNRICKVAEKELRKHSDAKTMNHYKVVVNTAQFLLDNNKNCNTLLKEIGFENVYCKISDSIIVLKNILTVDELDQYIEIIQKVLEE